MKGKKSTLYIPILLLLVALASTSCTFEIMDLEATRIASATKTAGVTPTATLLPSRKIALKSVHGQYITAMGGDDDWVLGQDTGLGPCGWFTLQRYANGKISLVTCHDRYVTSPESGHDNADWLLGQEPELSDCGQFDLYELGGDRVAFRTCAGRFFTPGDYSWPGLEWLVVAGTEMLDEWEKFTVLQQ